MHLSHARNGDIDRLGGRYTGKERTRPPFPGSTTELFEPGGANVRFTRPEA
jgi:hypothetical protein